jgi:hypothetical protein
MNNFPGQDAAGYSDLLSAFNNIVRSYMDRVDTVQPVEVVKVNGAFADVKPLVTHVNTRGLDIELKDGDVIPNVPVMTVAGNGGYLSFNVRAGDVGLLVASKFDISNFKKTGGRARAASARRFSWSDGFFLPLVMQSIDADFKIGKAGNYIRFKNGGIEINGNITHTGNYSQTGNFDISGNADIGGISTASDHVSDGISGKSHTHGPGSYSNSAGPVGGSSSPPSP